MTAMAKAPKNEFSISLFDLPSNRIYVRLKPEFNTLLFNSLKQKFGSISKLSQIIGVSQASLYTWFYSRQYPLIILKNFKDLMGVKETVFEKNLEGIKSGYYNIKIGKKGNVSKPISPKFPIKSSMSLARIISHLFGDGVVSISKKGYFYITYYNQNLQLRNQFKEDIQKVFGFEDFREGVHKTTNFISLPTIVGLILFQKIDSFMSNSCRVPDFIGKSNNDKIKREFVKAFLDDEAHVRNSPPHRYIEVALSNELFLRDLIELLNEFSTKTTKVYTKKTKKGFFSYYVYIRNFENLFNFHQKIGFTHPKKAKNLENILKSPGRKSYSHGETKNKIITLLKKRQFTTGELAKLLDRKICTINLFIGLLKKENKIRKIGKKGKFHLYEAV